MLVRLTISFIDTRLNGQKQKKKVTPLYKVLSNFINPHFKKESFLNIQNVLLIIFDASLGYTSPSI